MFFLNVQLDPEKLYLFNKKYLNFVAYMYMWNVLINQDVVEVDVRKVYKKDKLGYILYLCSLDHKRLSLLKIVYRKIR